MSKLNTEMTGVSAIAMTGKKAIEIVGKKADVFNAPETPAWNNDKYVTGTVNTTTNKKGLYSKVQPTNNKGWFPSYDQNNVFHTQTDWSISFWYQGVTNVKYVAPWYQNYASASNIATDYIAVWLGNGRIYLITSTGSSGTFRYWSVSNMSSLTHVVITGTQSTTTSGTIHASKLYINGTEYTSGSNGGSTQTIATTSIYRAGICGIGMSYNSTDSSWGTYGGSDVPSIDEITTWKKALTQADIDSLYNLGTPNNPQEHIANADLERYIRCGDALNDGTVLYDELDNTFELEGNNGNDFTTNYP